MAESSLKPMIGIQVDSPTVSASTGNTETRGSTRGTYPGRLSNRSRILLRVLWVAIVLLVVSLFIIATPAHHIETRTLYPESKRFIFQLGETDGPRLAQMGMSATFYALVLNVSDIAFMVVHLVLGLFVFSVRRNDWKALLFTMVLIIHGATYGQALRSLAIAEPAFNFPVSIIESIYWFSAFCTLLVFPDGRFTPRWTRWVALAFAIFVVLRLFIPAIDPIRMQPPSGSLIFSAIYLTGAAAQVYRYRKLKDRQQKRQISLVVFAMAFGVGCFALYNLLATAVPAFSQPGMARIYFNLLSVPLLVFAAMLLIPIFIVASIVRRRLWNIDVVVNKALVYSPLTALLGILYFASVLILQQLLNTVLGGEQSSIAIAASTLLIAFLFQPLRSRMQNIVDRAFAARSPIAAFRTEMRRNEKQPGIRANFGIYEVYEQIGRGGMAEVYRGRHPSLNRTVAIKMLSPNSRDNLTSLRRFEREAQTIATLRHPNIVQVFDFGTVDVTFYMVMEYLEGDTLAKYLHHNGRLTLKQALPIVQGIAGALDYAHEAGLIHRDVKPSNIMLQPEGEGKFRAVLTDFGVAKLTKGDQTLTNSGLVGTIDYMAPEQVVSQKSIDGRADVYSLGVVTFEMLTGRKPYNADSAGAVLLSHLQDPVPDPRTLVPEMDSSTAYAIMIALSKNANARYATAGEFYQGLRMSSMTVGV